LLEGFISKGLSNKVDVWDIKSNTWSRIVPLPRGLNHTTASVVVEKIHLVGGGHRKLFNLVNTSVHEVYDPKTDKWLTLALMPTARADLSISVIRKKSARHLWESGRRLQ
jgi:hypothetical protein